LFTVDSNATRSIPGNVLPRFSARRSIPAHAFALKKYLLDTDVSSTCDNKHTSASLGHSKELSVENSPASGSLGSIHITTVRPSTPWRFEWDFFPDKSGEKTSERVVFGIKNSGDVFP
jgi:hypothetical protein